MTSKVESPKGPTSPLSFCGNASMVYSTQRQELAYNYVMLTSILLISY